MEHEEDRLSSMSKTILHNILFKLPMKDAARTSVLSKAWLETWYTFTILSFCESNDRILGFYLHPGEDIVRKRNKLRLCDYAKRRMLKFCDQSLAMFMSKYVHIWIKMVGESDVEEDRLSSLPKIILHNILSRLPEKDAARTSVLSKAWLEIWYTFPILSFCDTKILGMNQRPLQAIVWKRNILKFCNHVTRRMLKLSDQRMVIRKFKLTVKLFGLYRMSKYVDFWLKLASECGVEVIKLSNRVVLNDDMYVLPMDVIEAKSLAKLVLEGKIKVGSTFMNRSIKFLSLRELSMSFVTLGDEHLIEHLISCCPLIEYITLKDCSVLSSGGEQIDAIKSLNLNGLQKLKGVDVSRIQEVFVDSLSLENLHYFPKDFHRTFKIDFDRCRNLKKLDLWSMTSTFFTDNWFLELFEKFSFLESLKFSWCSMPERIDISSAQLKVFELLDCYNLKEVNIDAPNLLSCRYDGTGASKPIIYFLRSFSQLEVNIKDMDLRDLREILQNIKPLNVLKSLYLLIDLPILDEPDPIDAPDPIVLQVSSPRPSIEHLELRFPLWIYKSMFLSIVKIIFSSCCPSTISFSLELRNSGPFIEFFYETLRKRKDDNCFCKSSVTKCWWHGLKDVMFATSTKIDENVDLRNMLESLPPSMEREKISFILKF